MKRISKYVSHTIEFIAATMLAVMFCTFLLQIFSRYVMMQPFGWTLEFCLILWVWIVFFGCAFMVRERDHVTFDVFYLATPRTLRKILALLACAAIVIGMVWAFLPTLDYIDWMKRRKTTTVENPFSGQKIPLRTIFSIYIVFMVALIVRYTWRFIYILKHDPPDEDHELPGHDPHPPHLRHGEDVI